jgi:lipoxygenase homology domain-containing protein 1
MADYRIVVKTGGANSAGTDANVYITLEGTSGNSGERQLDSVGNDFERSSVGSYSISTTDPLGDLMQVRIRHDNTGKKPGWFLDYITVHEEKSDRMWYFPCNRWLAVDEDDHLIDRTLDKQ